MLTACCRCGKAVMNLNSLTPVPHFLSGTPKTCLSSRTCILGLSRILRATVFILKAEAGTTAKGNYCIRETDPDIVLLLGDVKHSIPQTTRQDIVSLPAILSSFRGLTRLLIMPGNHDIGIEQFLDEGEILSKEGPLLTVPATCMAIPIRTPSLKPPDYFWSPHRWSAYGMKSGVLFVPAYLFAKSR